MPHETLSPFDLTVLSVIENSPGGNVPHTPAYQDALRRLSAAQQVYPNADYKDGHVTVASLSKLPSFHAQNIEALSAGQSDQLELNAAIFSRYVHSLPTALQSKAESHRLAVAGRPALHRAKHGAIVAHDAVHSLFLVPGGGPHPGLPGNYLYGFVSEGGPGVSATEWSLHIHDGDDGAAVYHAPNVQDAAAKLQEVLESAPFHLSELETLGFQIV